MKLDKYTPRNINHLPHGKWSRVRKFEQSEETYLNGLSTQVSAACIRFFQKRGMPYGFQSMSTSWWNDKQAKKAIEQS